MNPKFPPKLGNGIFSFFYGFVKCFYSTSNRPTHVRYQNDHLAELSQIGKFVDPISKTMATVAEIVIFEGQNALCMHGVQKV